MPGTSKSLKETKKGRQNRPVGKESIIKTDTDEDNNTPASASKSKSRVKSRKKSLNSKNPPVKRPKSRPTLILSKKMSKSLMKANKGQKQQPGRNSPEAKIKTSTKKQPKSKPRSGKVSGGGSGLSVKSTGRKCTTKGGAALACTKSFGPKQTGRGGEQEKTSLEKGGSVGKTGGGGNTIIFLGSPNDPAALELLSTLMKQINPSSETVPQQSKQPLPSASPGPGTEAASISNTSENSVVVHKQGDLEEVYDAMFELGNNVNTIHDSYEKIIASLVNLQHRRQKTKKEKAAAAAAGPTGGGTLIPSNSETKTAVDEASPANQETATEPGDISRFMDARTRSDAFAELFATVETLKEEMAPFNGCFNEGGFFKADLYEAERHRQITVGQRQSWLTQIRALSLTVEKLLAEYNKELLDMFRIVPSTA